MPTKILFTSPYFDSSPLLLSLTLLTKVPLLLPVSSKRNWSFSNRITACCFDSTLQSKYALKESGCPKFKFIYGFF